MTPKQRVLTALGGQLPDRVPFHLPYQGILLRDHWEDVTDHPWWVMFGYDLEASADVVCGMVEALGVDIVALRGCPPRSYREEHDVVVRDGMPVVVNSRAGEETPLERPTDRATHRDTASVPIENVGQLDHFVPLTRADDMLADGSLDLSGLQVEQLGDRYATIAPVGAPLWGALSTLGMQRGLLAFYDEPELLDALCDRYLTVGMERATALARIGADVIFIEECLTSGDLLGLEHFRQYGQPRTEQLIAHIHALGLRVIHYFCGDAQDRLELLCRAGPEAIMLEESKKGFDLDWARLAPRVPPPTCIVGNVSAIDLLPCGSSEQLGAEVRRQAQACLARGPYILSVGSPVTPATPLGRVRELADLGHGIMLA